MSKGNKYTKPSYMRVKVKHQTRNALNNVMMRGCAVACAEKLAGEATRARLLHEMYAISDVI